MFKGIGSLIDRCIKKRKKKKRKVMRRKKYNDSKNSYDEYGYNKFGFDKDGYNRGGYDKYGYDKHGYNRDGYNKFGFNAEGYSYSGYDRDGYDRNGYDRNGYDRNGLDRNGYDKQGYNINGENKKGIFYFDIVVENQGYLCNINKGSFLRIKRELNNIGDMINISIYYDRYYIGNVPENIVGLLIPQINEYNISNFTCIINDLSIIEDKFKINVKLKRAFNENNKINNKDIDENRNKLDKEKNKAD